MRDPAIILLVLAARLMTGQDIHYSQFWENPAMLNPALAGAEYKHRFSASFKDQWGSVSVPYRTYGISYDRRLNSDGWKTASNSSMSFRKKSVGRLAAGFSAYNDIAGDGKLGATSANLSLASFVPLDKDNYLSVGLQGGIIQRRLDAGALRFPDQFEDAQFDADLAGTEDLSAFNNIYGDLSAGLLWYYGENRHVVLVEQMLKAKMGVSFFHVARGSEQFLQNSSNRIQMKTVFHGDFVFGIRNTSSTFCPAYMLSLQGPSRELMVGGMIRTYIADNSIYTGLVNRTSFSYGAYYRNKDALMVMFNYDWQQKYSLGISYDVNVSSLSKSSSYRGGVEITLRITSGAAYLYQEKEKPRL
jgi:type IX secretion system PorP/SprF family membrane protein